MKMTSKPSAPQRLLAWPIAAALAVSALCPASAMAQQGSDSQQAGDSSARFDALVVQAQAAYEAREYDRAVELFEQAYALEPQPNILYNIAHIHERAGQIDKAITRYDEFLTAPEADVDLRRDALERRKLLGEIAQLRDQSGEASARAAANAAQDANLVNARAVDREEEGVGAAPWGFLVLGGASLAASAVLGVLTYRYDDTYSSSTDSLQERLDARDSGEATALAADITLGVGIASLGIGIVWYAVSSSSTDAPERAGVQWGPSISPTHAGVDMNLRF